MSKKSKQSTDASLIEDQNNAGIIAPVEFQTGIAFDSYEEAEVYELPVKITHKITNSFESSKEFENFSKEDTLDKIEKFKLSLEVVKDNQVVFDMINSNVIILEKQIKDYEDFVKTGQVPSILISIIEIINTLPLSSFSFGFVKDCNGSTRAVLSKTTPKNTIKGIEQSDSAKDREKNGKFQLKLNGEKVTGSEIMNLIYGKEVGISPAKGGSVPLFISNKIRENAVGFENIECNWISN